MTGRKGFDEIFIDIINIIMENTKSYLANPDVKVNEMLYVPESQNVILYIYAIF